MNQPAGIGIKDKEIGKVGRALPDDQETMSGRARPTVPLPRKCRKKFSYLVNTAL